MTHCNKLLKSLSLDPKSTKPLVIQEFNIRVPHSSTQAVAKVTGCLISCSKFESEAVMNHEWIKGLTKKPNTSNRSRKRDRRVWMAKEDATRIVRTWAIFMLAIPFLHCLMETVNAFLCQPPTFSKPTKTTRQKLNPKSILLQFSFDDRGGGSSGKTKNNNENKTNCFIWNHEKTKAFPANDDAQSHNSVLTGETFQTRFLLERRTLGSVTVGRTLAMVLGGGATSTFLAKSLPSQATAMDSLGSIKDTRERVLSIAPDQPKDAISGGGGDDDNIVDLPLEFIPTLGAYVVRYFLFGELFSAIVDTGSPFLTVPCYCKPYRNKKMFWGCYKPKLTRDSGYGNTIEGFDNNYGTVVWRKAGFSFSQTLTESIEDRASPSTTTADVVFGVLDRDLLNGSGGVFFGLIKETDRWIRPSFLGQTGYTSFCVDLRHNNDDKVVDRTNTNNNKGDRTPRLVLSKQSMIGTGRWRGTNPKSDLGERTDSEDWIPLVRDLKKKYGAPVVHYTAKASSFVVNGLPLLINKKKPLYVIFDTGVSGMVVSQELFDGRYLQARKNREKSLWGTVEVSFLTNSGKAVTLNATKPITTPLGKATPWKGFRGNLIAVGLAFLDGFATTIDVDDGKILFMEE